MSIFFNKRESFFISLFYKKGHQQNLANSFKVVVVVVVVIVAVVVSSKVVVIVVAATCVAPSPPAPLYLLQKSKHQVFSRKNFFAWNKINHLKQLLAKNIKAGDH